MEGRDLWKELGVDPGSDNQVIKRAYRELAIKYHPDKVRGDASKREAAAAKYARVTEAYRILTDNDALAEYKELSERGTQQVPFSDRYYHRHAHKYGIPPHDPLKVFIALVLIISALKYAGQYATWIYYRNMALSHPRYKAWAKAQGDVTGERLQLVGGVKPPTLDSIFAVQVLLSPYHFYRFARWLLLRVILRKPLTLEEKIEYLSARYALTPDEIAQMRAAYAKSEKEKEHKMKKR